MKSEKGACGIYWPLRVAKALQPLDISEASVQSQGEVCDRNGSEELGVRGRRGPRSQDSSGCCGEEKQMV